MRRFFILAALFSVVGVSLAAPAPAGTHNRLVRCQRFVPLTVIGVDEVVARQGDEDDGVGWFVAVPALMKPAPIHINAPIPGIPCDKKN